MKMNVKFGVVMGANLAVACVLMQGCKAPQAGVQDDPAYKAVGTAPAAAQPAEEKPVQPEAAAPAKPAEAKPVEKPVPAEPVVAPKPPPAPEPETTVYVVRSGDYLSKICKTYNIKQSAVLKANPGLDINKIRVGQKIKLPGKVEIKPAPAPVKATSAKKSAAKSAAPAKAAKVASYAPYTGATKEYVVKNGDMLGSIAQAYGITIRALKELNGLEAGPKGNALKVGQKLKVPAEKVAPAPAKAAPADAVKAEPSAPAAVEPKADAPTGVQPAATQNPPSAVAVPDAVDAKESAAPESKPVAPNADAASVTAAQVSDIQKGLETPAAAPAKPAVKTYTVKPDEDLYSIAINHSVSPSQILDANNLSGPEAVKAGMVLTLPEEAKAK